jgi:RimJ/RimL family protein N-acetyltransferase
MAKFQIETERLILREWRESDFESFYAMCNDPQVMEFLGPFRTKDEIAASIAQLRFTQDNCGFCFWAIERQADRAMIGFCGLDPCDAGSPLEGCVEIGWRLARNVWGLGYAHEAAKASLDWGFANLDDEAIWAITVPANTRSWGLMERLGMTRHHDLDFDHPRVPDDSPLKRHITYSIRRDQWPETI